MEGRKEFCGEWMGQAAVVVEAETTVGPAERDVSNNDKPACHVDHGRASGGGNR